MPYTATGWRDKDPLHVIDGALLCESLSQKARKFANIMPTSASTIRETCRRMTTADCDFWHLLDREFTPGEELQKAGIVYVLLQTIPYDNVHFYDACSLILLAAIRSKASLMVIKIIAQLCPYALTYSEKVTEATPAHEAIMHQSDLDVVKVLTQSGEYGIQMVDRDGLCLLHYAAMYRGSLELVKYLHDLNPDFVQYRTTNAEVFATRVEIIGVLGADGEKTYIDNGEVFVCPGKSTVLNIALHQNRHKNVNPENGPVIQYLDHKSTTVKLIPDSFQEIPFIKLIQGVYSDQTRTALIALFCSSHANHGQAAAFCSDRKGGNILLQVAVQERLSPACLEYLTYFTIDSITNLREMIFTMYETREPCMNYKSGIHFLNIPVLFSATGIISSVNGFRIRSSTPIFNEDSRCASHHVQKYMPILMPLESYAMCQSLGKWFNPVTAPLLESAILKHLIEYLRVWFAGWRQMETLKPMYEKCYNIVISHLTSRIRLNASGDRKIADQIATDLLAEEEAAKMLQLEQQTRPSRKARWKQKQEAEAAEKKAAEEEAAANDTSSRAALLLQASIAARQNGPPPTSVQRDSQNAVSNHRQREIDRERDREQWQALQRQRDIQCEKIALEDPMSLRSLALDDDDDDEPDTGRAVSSRNARRSRHQRQVHVQSNATQAGSAHQLPTVLKTQESFEPDIDIDFLCSLLLEPDNDMEKTTAGADDGDSHDSLDRGDIDLRRSGWNMNAEFAARYAAAVGATQQYLDHSYRSMEILDDVDGEECLLCLDGPIGTRFAPCGHECYCLTCSQDPKFQQQVREGTASCLLCCVTIRATEVI